MAPNLHTGDHIFELLEPDEEVWLFNSFLERFLKRGPITTPTINPDIDRKITVKVLILDFVETSQASLNEKLVPWLAERFDCHIFYLLDMEMRPLLFERYGEILYGRVGTIEVRLRGEPIGAYDLGRVLGMLFPQATEETEEREDVKRFVAWRDEMLEKRKALGLDS